MKIKKKKTLQSANNRQIANIKILDFFKKKRKKK